MTADIRVFEFLKQADAFFVATEDGDMPKVRPHNFIMLYEDKICFTTANSKPTYRQLSQNPNVEICALKNGEWLRYHGRAVFITDYASKTAALDTMPSLKQMYSADDNLLEVFYLADATADLVTIGKQGAVTETLTLSQGGKN